MPKFDCKVTPLLRKAVGHTRRLLGTQRTLLGAIESTVKDLTAKSAVFQPVYGAAKLASEWRANMSTQLEKIARGMDTRETENVLAAIIDPTAGRFHNLTSAQQTSATKMRSLWTTMLQDTAGLSKKDALRFIQKDFATLRAANGDVARVAGLRNSYPDTFHPIFDDIVNGGLNATQSNAYAVGWNFIHMGEKIKWLEPAAKEATKTIRAWSGLKDVAQDDIAFAQHHATEFLKHMVHQRDTQRTFFAETMGNAINRMNKTLGRDKVDVDNDTINRWAANMASWYGGMAMSFRPALAIRNMTQVMLPMAKVGFGRGGRALKLVYGKDRAENIGRALKALGIPENGEAPVYLAEGAEGFLGKKFFRQIKRMQNFGMIPFRWADRVNNRATTYLMGELAILEEAPALLRKSNPISWEMFMMRSGLKGSSPVDQARIKSLLLGVEHPNVRQAAREFGKELVADTQFIYEGLNAPAAFRGTAGRMFGQFGTWPLSFAEYMHQNVAGPRDMAWAQKFLGNYAIQKAALSGVGLATGIDTSSWNFANPLTFQGGPWFQTLRDVTILGTSQNEFERRQARGLINRQFGILGTPYTTVFNPLGSVTNDILQAKAAESPVEAALLALGFNTRANKPATRR